MEDYCIIIEKRETHFLAKKKDGSFIKVFLEGFEIGDVLEIWEKYLMKIKMSAII